MQTIDFKIHILPLGKKMTRFAGQLLKDGEEAKDAVQDTFLKLWQKKDELNKIDNLDAFVMRMIRNRCLDLIRARRVTSLDDGAERKLQSEAQKPHDRVELEDTAERIRSLIGRLPEQQQTVIFLRDIENHEYEDITEVTGMNTNAIRVNLSRARKKVRDELLKTWENETRRDKNIAGKIF